MALQGTHVLPAQNFVLSVGVHAGAGVLTNVQFRQQWFAEVNKGERHGLKSCSLGGSCQQQSTA
jgi:hypothetical protein